MAKERVDWGIAVRVWWAMVWRWYLATLALVAVTLGVTTFIAADAGPVFALLLPFIWVWSVRESLVNDYKPFELQIKRRDDSQPS